eukprot:1148616-Pelagomonas_calceolata.AAC.2
MERGMLAWVEWSIPFLFTLQVLLVVFGGPIMVARALMCSFQSVSSSRASLLSLFSVELPMDGLCPEG